MLACMVVMSVVRVIFLIVLLVLVKCINILNAGNPGERADPSIMRSTIRLCMTKRDKFMVGHLVPLGMASKARTHTCSTVVEDAAYDVDEVWNGGANAISQRRNNVLAWPALL